MIKNKIKNMIKNCFVVNFPKKIKSLTGFSIKLIQMLAKFIKKNCL